MVYLPLSCINYFLSLTNTNAHEAIVSSIPDTGWAMVMAMFRCMEGRSSSCLLAMIGHCNSSHVPSTGSSDILLHSTTTSWVSICFHLQYNLYHINNKTIVNITPITLNTNFRMKTLTFKDGLVITMNNRWLKHEFPQFYHINISQKQTSVPKIV